MIWKMIQDNVPNNEDLESELGIEWQTAVHMYSHFAK